VLIIRYELDGSGWHEVRVIPLALKRWELDTGRQLDGTPPRMGDVLAILGHQLRINADPVAADQDALERAVLDFETTSPKAPDPPAAEA
jgi:hypothetical protein